MYIYINIFGWIPRIFSYSSSKDVRVILQFFLRLVLYKDCWDGFWVRSWWPRVLWQAVTFWYVNRRMAVRRGRPVEQVCNWKETTWYENHAVRFRKSVQSEESRARDTQLIRGVRSSRTIRLALAPPGSRKKIWSKKKSPLWEYVSPSICQTYNKLCAPFENKNGRDVFW